MQPPLDWGAEALWLALEPLLPGLTVEVVAAIGSTNTELLARARQSPADAHKPALLVAVQQTAGRGRQGKTWVSGTGPRDAGASLTFSLALPLAMADWSGLSLAVGLALAEALDPASGTPGQPLRLGLKWPNDLLLLDDGGQAPHIGRKLGGILIETVQLGPQRLAVLGIGLNIRPLPAADGTAASDTAPARAALGPCLRAGAAARAGRPGHAGPAAAAAGARRARLRAPGLCTLAGRVRPARHAGRPCRGHQPARICPRALPTGWTPAARCGCAPTRAATRWPVVK